MKKRTELPWLVPMTFVLLAIAAGVGLLWPDRGNPYFHETLQGEQLAIYGRGLYAAETPFFAGAALGTDLAALCVFLPLLAISFIYYRGGSLRGGLLLAGVLSAVLYYAAFRALDTAYNPLFPLYIVLFSASFYAFAVAMAAFDLVALPGRFSARFPRRGLSALMFVAGLGTAFVWLSDLIPAIAAGQVPAALGTHTTIVTYAVDLGIIVPATFLSGILLLRRDGRGYLWSTVLAIMLAMIGAMVIGQTVMQLRAGVEFTPGVLIGMVGSWIVMGAAAVWLAAAVLRSVVPEGARRKTGNAVGASPSPGDLDAQEAAEIAATWNLLNPP